MMKKNNVIILALLAIGLGSVLYMPESKGGFFKKLGKKIKKTAKKVGKEIKKTGKKAVKEIEKTGKKAVEETKKVAEKTFDVAKDVGDKIKDAGEDTIDAVERIGEDVWKKISGIEDCLNVVKYGSAWTAARASYESAKRSMEVSSAGLRFAGDVANKLKDIPADMLEKGINITKFKFRASVADTIKMKTPKFKVEGKAFGKKFSIEVGLDASDMEKLVTGLFEAIVEDVAPAFS